MIEILIPVRNPTAVFDRTIESILWQTDRRFKVLISDNYSLEGKERIDEAVRRLEAAGIEARLIRPPVELGRVQHWNWLHAQATADWLKPLFVGDWLERDCVGECLAVSGGDAAIGFILFYFIQHRGLDGPVYARGDCFGSSGRITPLQAAEMSIFQGNFAGGPINVIYRRDAYQAAGGHQGALPLVADYDLYVRLSLQTPTCILPKVLGHFTLHENRFAKRGSGTIRESMCAELLLAAALTAYGAKQLNLPLAWDNVIARLGELLLRWIVDEAARAAGRCKRAILGRPG